MVALAEVLNIALGVLYWALIIRALLSWVSPDPWNPIVQLLNRVTEPVLSPIRRAVPFLVAGLDFTPLVAILAIYFTRLFLVKSLLDFAARI